MNSDHNSTSCLSDPYKLETKVLLDRVRFGTESLLLLLLLVSSRLPHADSPPCKLYASCLNANYGLILNMPVPKVDMMAATQRSVLYLLRLP